MQRESNWLLQVIITDRIGCHKVLLKFITKIVIKPFVTCTIENLMSMRVLTEPIRARYIPRGSTQLFE